MDENQKKNIKYSKLEKSTLEPKETKMVELEEVFPKRSELEIVPLEDVVSERHNLLQNELKNKNLLDRFIVWLVIGKEFAIQTLKQIRKTKVSFCLGFLACFVVVMVVSLLLTVLGNTPVVFLKLAELNSGETDLFLTSAGGLQLNYSTFSEVLSQANQGSVSNFAGEVIEDPADFYSYHSPRYTGYFSLFSKSSCQSVYDLDIHHEREICSGFSRAGFMYAIDTEKEKRMGLGRDWNYPPLQKGEIYLSSQLASDLGVKSGDTIFLEVDFFVFLGSLWNQIFPNKNENLNNLIYINVTIKNTYVDSGGKYPSGWKRMLIMEYGTMKQYLLDQLDPFLTEAEKERFNSSNLYG